MFLIASSGRCGTAGICAALDRCSDHEVRHERHPQLLDEAWRKHHGEPYATDRLRWRLDYYARRQHDRYGEAVRVPNLLGELLDAAPAARALIVVRDPADYVVSAYAKGAQRSGNEWDRTRLLGERGAGSDDPAVQLLDHWTVVNRYLLAVAEHHADAVVVARYRRWETLWPAVADHLGVRLTEPVRFDLMLGGDRNVSPVGFELGAPELDDDASALWERAQDLFVD